MDLKFANLGVFVQEANQIKLREQLQCVQVIEELHLHHQMLRLARPH